MNLSVAEITQVFTAPKYGHNNPHFNYEILEYFGDSVLKLLATIEVFLLEPKYDEGSLHIERMLKIKNNNLKRISIKEDFAKFIFCKKFKWVPEGCFLTEEEKLKEIIKLPSESNKRFIKFGLKQEELEFLPENYKEISDKMLADVVEALIGLYYVKFRNLDICQKFLNSISLLDNRVLKLRIQVPN